MKFFLLGLIIAVAGGLGFYNYSNQPDARVLFVGNSYTSTNDLPGVVAEIASQNGLKLQADAIAPGGWFLEDHVNNAQTMDTIRTGDYDFVIVQEQSMAPASPQVFAAKTFPAATRLAAAIDGSGATLIFYQTWGHERGNAAINQGSYADMQHALIDSYRKLGRSFGGTIAPVGEAWETTRAEQPTVKLYTADGSHPSQAGTYLAASVMATTILEVDLTVAPAIGVSDGTAASLQKIANAIR